MRIRRTMPSVNHDLRRKKKTPPERGFHWPEKLCDDPRPSVYSAERTRSADGTRLNDVRPLVGCIGAGGWGVSRPGRYRMPRGVGDPTTSVSAARLPGSPHLRP